ncbi:(d)CMP kinase [Deltaproteobacteria bacterium]|nr:(d)CMP kinase [Deltaproteobacteria bacterium]
MNRIITVDGPAGSGKSTVSRLLAKKLGFIYLDTGAMYRAVALHAGREGIDFEDGKGLYEMCREMDINFASKGDNFSVYLGDEDISLEIRKPEMDMLSSRISMIKEVRDAMTELQRKIGREGRLVAEGRDMGTVVFPDADHKYFITGSVEVRAARRYSERIGRGESVSMEEVEADLRKRDEQDKNRPISPLRPAEDAIIIDTTPLGIDQVVEEILDNMGASEIR